MKATLNRIRTTLESVKERGRVEERRLQAARTLTTRLDPSRRARRLSRQIATAIELLDASRGVMIDVVDLIDELLLDESMGETP